MGMLRKDGLKGMSMAVRPSLADAIRRYADDNKVTMTHVIVTFVCQGLKRKHYWPPNTLEERQRKRQRAIVRRKIAAKRRTQPPAPSAGKRTRNPGKPIADRRPRPISDRRPRPIGDRKPLRHIPGYD